MCRESGKSEWKGTISTLRTNSARRFTDEGKLVPRKDTHNGKIARGRHNDENASDERLVEQLFDFLRHDLIGAMEINANFLPSSSEGIANPMGD